MAAVIPTITRVSDNVLKAVWTPLVSANAEGVALHPRLIQDFADRSVQITGTAGTGTVKMQGSNDETNFASLTDPQGNAIEKTASGTIEQIMENTTTVKPVMTGANGTDSWTVTMFLRRQRSGKGI
jgi:hypothetical protein